MATKFEPDPSKRRSGAKAETSVSRNCTACLGKHGLCKCEKFKGLSIGEKGKFVLSKRLCFKCLKGGHFKDRCPKGAFKCQVQGCAEDHNTLLHPTPRIQRDIRAGVTSVSYVQSIPHSVEGNDQQTAAATGRQNEAHIVSQEGQGVGAAVTASTGSGEERLCLGVLPVRVKAKGGGTVVETYALLDSGSEVTLSKEELSNKLGSWGSILDYELQGVTGVRKVKGLVLVIFVMVHG